MTHEQKLNAVYFNTPKEWRMKTEGYRSILVPTCTLLGTEWVALQDLTKKEIDERLP